MADISQDLQKILDAIYGEEVRGSIYHAISLINDVSEVILTTGTDITAPTDSSEGYFTGSLYLNLDTYELWKCIGTNAWQSLGILKGATGDNGNKWYRGLAVSGKAVLPTVYPTGIANANANDCYLNPSEGAIYHCVTGGDDTTATWSYDFTMTGGGGGGSIVAWTQIQGSTGGVKIAEIDIDGSVQEVYAPEGGGGGGMLPYLYIDSEAGATVTVAQPDGTTITPTAAGSGHWECELTGGYGTYVIHSVLSGQGDATLSLAVDTVKEYHVTDTHYDYTINVTAPSGSTVRIVGGGETYTGTGTGTSQAFAVHTPSTVYTVTATQIMDGNTKTDEATVTSAATSGGSTNVTLSIEFGTINVSVAADFVTAGSTITCAKTGINTISKTAANTLTFRVPETGEYTISGTVSGTPYSITATVTDLNTPESASLATTLTLSVDLYSAAVDTVSFTDDEGVKTVTTDTDGHATATIKILPAGKTITFTSSVALDPENLDGSHYYSKTISVTSSTTEIYVMPNNALYWWGYRSPNCEIMSTSNGWENIDTNTYIDPTFSTNSVSLNGPSGRFCGLATTQMVSVSKSCCIVKGETLVSDRAGYVSKYYPSKNSSSRTYNTDGIGYTNNIQTNQITWQPSFTGYATIETLSGRTMTCYAFWVE